MFAVALPIADVSQFSTKLVLLTGDEPKTSSANPVDVGLGSSTLRYNEALIKTRFSS
jgi:hypothetical protein